MVVVVPALEPEAEHMLPFLADLRAHGFSRIIVVDDGSPEGFQHVFDAAERDYGCTVLRHEVNRGKGAALKTAFDHCASLPDVAGIITADSDGQHRAQDIYAVAQALQPLGPRGVVFGSRRFDGDHVPSKSRMGNQLTSRIVQALFGQYVADTQTGLRGFAREVALESTHVRGERFEYEMNVLLWLISKKFTIVEVPIETIYHDIDNSITHFRPIRDSMRIYSIIFAQFGKFLLASVSGAALDLALYAMIMMVVFPHSTRGLHIITAVVAARVVSSIANFSMNRWLVFRDDGRIPVSAGRYFSLAVVIMVLSALGSWGMSIVLHGHTFWAKVIVDAILFVLSYLVQKRWVFAGDKFLEE